MGAHRGVLTLALQLGQSLSRAQSFTPACHSLTLDHILELLALSQGKPTLATDTCRQTQPPRVLTDASVKAFDNGRSCCIVFPTHNAEIGARIRAEDLAADA